ncbi:sensor histidine kinase [Enterococcus hulanensis]|uniref:ATP-binding protein n=1 Tax=Enterococcus hulanensis TaxID=2559929 RepID=UPI001A90A940|nr:ATP-binding protein [Enterococcus hulanensis]MBO0457495.1 sensor histidine kinase [Enterococcus hulanensis]
MKNERAYITFSNQTTNFDAANLPHLFDKFTFFSQDSNSMSSGLGLTIVKELVEKMNGTIEGSYQDECLVITMSFQSEHVE